MDSEAYMRRALELAEHGRGRVEPNPLVGAVVEKDGQIVGEGWHEAFGQSHAEINALAMAGQAARGSTCFVTLEPCCHQGKTPPCTDALIRAGVARVVAALADPFPEVSGRGAAQLRAAGILVEIGLCEAEARRQNAPYLMLVGHGRPWVHVKWAMSLDGKIAARTGESKWISNESSRRKAHELRGRMDGIVIGIGTALADNPLLTARPPGPRTPCRVVLDSRGRLPRTSTLVKTARETPTLVVTSAPAEVTQPMIDAGCQVLHTSGKDRVASLAQFLQWTGERRWTNLLVEGGAEVLGAFLDADAIDEAHVFIAPKLLGGCDALSAVAGKGFSTIANAWTPAGREIATLDGNVYYHAWRDASPSRFATDH